MFEHYPRYEEWFARGQLICVMVAMGANLKVTDFVRIARAPQSLVLGLAGQVFVIPLLALGLSRLFDLEPAMALGLILVSAMPGGALSKYFTYLGHGNAPLSITLSALTTLGAIITVPATLQLLASDFMPADFKMPHMKIVGDVVMYLLAPLTVGMLAGALWPRRRIVLARWCMRLGILLVVMMVVGSLGSGRIRPAQHGLRAPAAITLFCVLGAQINMLPFYLFPLPRQDRMAVGIEVTMRNMNLAILLTTSLFHGDLESEGGVLFVVLFYAGVAMLAGLPLVWNHRRLVRRAAEAEKA